MKKNNPAAKRSGSDVASTETMHPRSQIISFWKEYLVITLCCLAVYGQTLRYEFVTYDDYEIIVQNGDFLSKVSNIGTLFETHAGITHQSSSAYYRPIQLSTYVLDYQLWQLNPFGYHLTSVVLHIMVALLVFLLMLVLLRERMAALLASLLFALHPVQTESVAWISGRIDLLLGFTTLLMLYCYVQSHERPEHRTRYLVFTVISFVVGLFTKESSVFYLLLLPLYDLCFVNSTIKQLFSRRNVVLFAGMGAILALYLILRLNIIGSVIGAEELYGTLPLGERLMNAPAIFAEHLALLVAPVRLSIVHTVNELPWLQAPWNIVAYAILPAIVAAIWWSWRNDKVLCFALSWIVIGLLPTLNILPIAVPIMEHRLYVPMIGFALAVSRIAVLLLNAARQKRIHPYAVAAVIILYGIFSLLRVPVWHDSAALWNDAIERSPRYDRAYFNLAGYYFDKQQYDKTITLLQKYIELKPDDFIGYSKLRQTYYLTGRYNDAAYVCRQLIARSPTVAARYVDLGRMYEQLSLPDSAALVYGDAIRLHPEMYQLRDLLGNVYVSMGKLDEAKLEYKRVIETNPLYAPPYYGMGKLAAAAKQYPEAVQWIEEGIQRGDPTQDMIQLLHFLYQQTGATEKAQALEQQFAF